MKALLARLLLLLASTLLVLVVAEAGLRGLEKAGLVGAGPAVFDDVAYMSEIVEAEDDYVLMWELDPAGRLVNRAGMRGPDVPVSKPDGVRRIAMLGDSVTFGRGVADEAIFATRVAQALNEQRAAHEPRVEVLNLGVGGYNTEQAVRAYETKARAFDPDVVVLVYVLNDAITTEAALRALEAMTRQKETAEAASPARRDEVARGEEVAPADEVPRPDADGADPLAWSALARFVRERAERIDSESITQGKTTTAKSRAPFVEKSHADAEGWALVTRGFDTLAGLARQDEAPVLLAIVPMLIDFDDYPFAEIHARVAEAGRERGFAVLDLFDALRDEDVTRLRHDEVDLTHPNAAGHAAIAAAVEARLREDAVFRSALGRGTADGS